MNKYNRPELLHGTDYYANYNQHTNTMHKLPFDGEYVAPEANVIEIGTRSLLCTSTTDMTVDPQYDF